MSCEKCHKSFKTLRLLKQHERIHNTTCEICSISFKTPANLRQHSRENHPKTKNYKCRVCPGLLFNSEKEYLLHVRDSHDGKIIESHMCSDCGKTFRTGSELTLHMKSKCGTDKQYICKECGKKMMSPGSLYTHLKRHKGNLNFMCRFCAKCFLTSGQLKVHERRHTKQKDFVCDICHKGFCHRQSLITHISVHTGIKPYQCEGCGKSFSCISNLLKHRKSQKTMCGLLPMTSHRVKNPATKIKLRINTPESSKLKRAQMKRELEMKFACLEEEIEREKSEIESGNAETAEILDGRFGLKDFKLDNNFSVATENESTVVDLNEEESESSKKTDKSILALDDNAQKTCHENVQPKQQNPSEKLENEQFSDVIKSELATHTFDSPDVFDSDTSENESTEEYKPDFERTKRKTSPRKRRGQSRARDNEVVERKNDFACPDCPGSAFSRAAHLKLHRERAHEGAAARKRYVYVCDKCGKKFRAKCLLANHESADCGRRPTDKCEVCDKHFANRYTLKAHMIVHSEKKSMACAFCGKTFHWKGQLKVHERSHTGEKPYACLFCPSSFAYRDSLIRHSSLHTGVKPYLCECCGWGFTCIGNLIKHKVTHAATCGAWYEDNDKQGAGE